MMKRMNTEKIIRENSKNRKIMSILLRRNKLEENKKRKWDLKRNIVWMSLKSN